MAERFGTLLISPLTYRLSLRLFEASAIEAPQLAIRHSINRTVNVNKLKPHLNKLLLAFIFLILASSTIAWTIKDRTPPSWDPSHHTVAAYDYYRPLAHFDMRGFAREVFVNKQYYAPFIHLVTAIAFLIFGASRLSA